MNEAPADPIIPADGRLISIDVLRGLAILWVIILHIWEPVTLEFGPRRLYYQRFADRVMAGHLQAAMTALAEVLFKLGDHGVTMFMILSGVSLTITTLRRGGKLSLRRFYVQRFRRLLIPYWAGWALFLVTLAGMAVYRVRADGGSFTHNFEYLGLTHEMNLRIAINGLLIAPRAFTLADALSARPPALWFVLLLAQYYVLFAMLLPLLRRVGPAAFTLVVIGISLASSAWMIWQYGDIDGAHGWVWSNWIPFRLVEFGVGMALGYTLVSYPALLRRFFSRPPVMLLAVLVGLALHTAGSLINGTNHYWNVWSYTLIVLGLATIMGAIVSVRPGFVLTSAPARLIAWVGSMSYAVLITNESFRLFNYYTLLQGWLYTPAWWFFIVVLYVPLTVILAYPLAVALGLVPARAEARDQRGVKPQPAPSVVADRLV